MHKEIGKVLVTEGEFSLIQHGERLKDCHVNKFHEILRENFFYDPLDVLLLKTFIRYKDTPGYVYKYEIPRDKSHIQILHNCDGICPNCIGGHWICTYYDTNTIWILDPLNLQRLHCHHLIYLRSIYPYISEVPIKYVKVQGQRNAVECGVYSIAYAISSYL